MFLKSLTLRGFKSFADKTVLEFEPGIMVVVGPNGSGKSNLVDAVAWVLGAQGPRTLRGGKMDDVIFAGTPDRPALGRAEVSLTIDNSAGPLPIEFSEVTITRTLFRNGDSEYAINGAPCRLLDIQELLSDTGIGRQQHVIVGQGQIDAVLNSRPEDRRAVIEEAAGILKYRKRREKAERRLEATEGNLLRLNDLLREVRRGLAPLQKQADAARRHGGLVSELHAIRLHLAGHELAGLQAKGERLRDQSHALARTEATVQARLRELDLAVLDAEQALTDAGHGDVADALVRVESMRERARGLRALLGEKQRGLARELAAAADEGVIETLVADAGGLRAELVAVDEEVAAAVGRVAEVEAAERRVAAELEAFEAGAPQADPGADARAVGRELAARGDALARVDAELARLDARADGLEARIARLGVSTGPSLEDSRRHLADAESRLGVAETAWRDATADVNRWQSRAEALGQSLDDPRSRAGATLLAGFEGVAGSLVDYVDIEEGTEAAVAGALGDAMSAVVVTGGARARDAVERLAGGDARALLLVLDERDTEVTPGATLAPTGARALAGCVRSHLPGLQATLTRLLGGYVLAEGGWQAAVDLAIENSDLTVMTRAGDRFGGGAPWRFGSGESATVTRAALEEAIENATSAEAAAQRAEAALGEARAVLGQTRETERAAGEAARAERERDERASELEAVRAERVGLLDAQSADRARIAELEAQLPALVAAEADAQTRQTARAEARVAIEERMRVAVALRRELDVRAAATEERRALLTRRLDEVEVRLARDPEAKAAAERYRAALERKAGAYEEVEQRLDGQMVRIEGVLGRLREERRAQTERANAAGGKLEVLRTERSALERELAETRERQQRREVEDAETRMRLEAVVERIRTEFDTEPATALDAPAPEVADGTTLAGRARDLERELRIMGPINPLALEEFDALQERHDFLSQQLEDVKNSRRELQRVIKAVDREIVSVFETAFADVRENFSSLFATLFPGGSGRIFLTDPADLLSTGIEMEARPSGKNTRRLSLLSGGERSLTAMAFLFGVFRARPSPFYLLDEVEAALDDVNLHRFLDLVHEFRDDAQLLIVSHQKRTMEAGDCLYGVSMPPGGSSRVISQRMRGEIVLD